MKTELIIVCPHCKNRVLPKADGICPSCRKNVNERPERATRNQKFQIPAKRDEIKNTPRANPPAVSKKSSKPQSVTNVRPVKREEAEEKMQLRIDFYSKDEMAVSFQKGSLFSDEKTSELFMFACFTLRQLNNLGEHLVGIALAGCLISKYNIQTLADKNPQLSDGVHLLKNVDEYVLRARGLDGALLVNALMERQFGYMQDARIKMLTEDYVEHLPLLVPNKGEGNKSFVAIAPPLIMNMKGFGLFGWQVTYYSFHSVIGLIRTLLKKHADDERFLGKLVDVANSCGGAYIFKQIPVDQAGLAKAIIQKIS